MKNIDYIKLGKNIRSKRLMSGLTMEQLAEKCYISTGFLGHIENGNRARRLTRCLLLQMHLTAVSTVLFTTSMQPIAMYQTRFLNI